MDFGIGADINDAFASRMPAAPGAGPGDTAYAAPKQAVASQPVVLTPMTVVRSPHQHAAPPGTPPASQSPLDYAQPASASHLPFVPEPAPFVYSGGAQAAPAAEPGYLDLLAARRKDVLKLTVLALMVTLGIGVHSLLSHYTKAWIDAGQFSPRQEFFARLIYPLGVLFTLWNLKALQ